MLYFALHIPVERALGAGFTAEDGGAGVVAAGVAAGVAGRSVKLMLQYDVMCPSEIGRAHV